MGQVVRARCLECGEHFTLSRGGGFTFHLLACETCGRTTAISFAALGELHLRYLKGLPGPYCLATAEHDERVRTASDVRPISTEEYHRQIEELLGKCRCGGKYAFAAPPRCPRCRSARIQEGEVVVCYD